MIVVVVDGQPEPFPFTDAVRYRTDEHNNLEVLGGPDGETLLQLFAESRWVTVFFDDGED